jgi:hypothetical protein
MKRPVADSLYSYEDQYMTFRAIGTIVIAFAIVCLLLVAVNRYPAAHGGRDLSGGTFPATALLVIGVGLFFGKRLAAILFALITGIMGVWLCIGSLISVPMPFALINIAMGLGLLSPCIAVRRHWSELKW